MSPGRNANQWEKRKTLAGNIKDIFRIIQSVPSPKAEPFKLWLANVGKERIEEIEDPEIGIDRLMETYLLKVLRFVKNSQMSGNRGVQKG